MSIFFYAFAVFFGIGFVLAVQNHPSLKLDQKKQSSRKTAIIVNGIFVLVFALLGYAFTDFNVSSPSADFEKTTTVEKKEKIAQVDAYPADFDRSDAMQKERRAYIDMLTKQDVFMKDYKRSKFASAVVGKQWYGLPYEEKQRVASVVYAFYYAQDIEADILMLEDGYTGKGIGGYSHKRGLVLD